MDYFSFDCVTVVAWRVGAGIIVFPPSLLNQVQYLDRHTQSDEDRQEDEMLLYQQMISFKPNMKPFHARLSLLSMYYSVSEWSVIGVMAV